MRVLITGGAGFVGSNLAFAFKHEHPPCDVVVFDNLHRRGSEHNLAALKKHGIEFIHGDIRLSADFEQLTGEFDVLIEASAEPSVLAGVGGSNRYVLDTNLKGTLNCLEFARKHAETFLFLSTSRVYSIDPLRQIPLREGETRFLHETNADHPGLTPNGINESFPTHTARSLYGATKLASELVIQEYSYLYGLKSVINRCGVIAGPGQFGKVDQGVFTLWVANHFFNRTLKYTGFSGKGKQVRDLLHPADLYALISKQLAVKTELRGEIYNVGGGLGISTSLCELTSLCREATGTTLRIETDSTTNMMDIPWYVSDCSKASSRFGWQPERQVKQIVGDILEWLRTNETILRSIFT